MEFKPRMSRPEAGNKYYITKANGGYSNAIKGKPVDQYCDVLSNCVGYAYGRFNEIGGYGSCKYLSPVNAENFIEYANGLSVGQTPKLGSCMVWRKGTTLKGDDGAGHVAIVEKIISDTEIVTSESGYGSSTPFYTKTRKKGDGNWGQSSAYAFRGFIYNPAVADEQPKSNTQSAGVYGIDVSVYQGSFNFSTAKSEGVKFAIIKGGGGDSGLYIDKNFATNYKNAKAHGIAVGCYWFSKAITEDDAVKEASYFYENCLKGKQFELPIYIDVENKQQLAIGKTKLTAVIKAWCDYLAKKNFCVGIYASKAVFGTYFDDSLPYEKWVAQWSSKCTYAKPYGMWQYAGGTAKVAGISCDQDIMLIDYPSKIKAAKQNGFGGTTPVDNTTQNVKPVLFTLQLHQLKNGMRGNDVKALQTLLNGAGTKYNCGTADGIWGAKTDVALRKYQTDNNLGVDGIAGANTFKSLLGL